jgi:beta-carotene hydroxylase
VFMNKDVSKEFKLPEYFLKTNEYVFLYYIAHGMSIWFGSAYLVLQVINSGLPTVLVFLLASPLIILSGMGMFFVSSLGHEGFHGNLSSSKKISMILGIIISSTVPTYLTTGYAVHHWDHHRFTNTEKDPDYQVYSKLTNFFLRGLIGPSSITSRNLVSCIKMALGRYPCLDNSRNSPFSRNEGQVYSGINMALAAMVIIGCAYLYHYSALYFIVFIALPLVVNSIYFSMSPFIEHAGMEKSRLRNSRVYSHPFFSIMFLGYNYHICHHLYPNVQVHKLRRLYYVLLETGRIDEKMVRKKSFLEVLRIGMFEKL